MPRRQRQRQRQRQGPLSSATNLGLGIIGHRSICERLEESATTSSSSSSSPQNNNNPPQQQLTMKSFFVSSGRKKRKTISNSIIQSPATTPTTKTYGTPGGKQIHHHRTPPTESSVHSSRVFTPPSPLTTSHQNTLLSNTTTPPVFKSQTKSQTKTKTKTNTLMPKKKLQQVYLDCGQSNLGQQLCKQCGMLYMPGVQEDMQAHAKMCQERTEGVVWRNHQSLTSTSTSTTATVTGSRQQRIVWQSSSSSVSGISSKDPRRVDTIVSLYVRKGALSSSAALTSVYHQVVQDLGMDESTSIDGYTVWLYLQNHRVVGFVATKPVQKAFPLICKNGNDELKTTTATTMATAMTVDRHSPQNIMLGIAILWTHDHFRKEGIASKLVTAARKNAFFGMIVPKDKIAFSTPTDNGYQFARKYLYNSSKENVDQKVLVYDYHNKNTTTTTKTKTTQKNKS